ncbi:SPASM domain-containing protein [Sporanaerobacter acetigenes]|uniref:SPASM domain-containing protein n=1 Tax=Sporanaerobacter acetigenes TaxID=165813 RepID=UPI0009FEA594
MHWYVNEDGAVYPCTYCQREELSIGNLIDNPDLFNEIIYNGKYEEYNQRIANNFYVINDLYRYQKLSINDICSNIREAEIQDKL